MTWVSDFAKKEKYMITFISKRSDILGAASSALCIVHCIISPLIFAVAPFIGYSDSVTNHDHGKGMWDFMDVIFLILGLIAVQFTKVKFGIIKKILWASWFVLAMGLGLDRLGSQPGHFLMYTGSSGLIFTHIINYFVKR